MMHQNEAFNMNMMLYVLIFAELLLEVVMLQ